MPPGLLGILLALTPFAPTGHAQPAAHPQARLDGPVLAGTVGLPTDPNAFSITLTDPNNSPVTSLPPGAYTFNIRDLATFHNFHLTGPGVDEATDIAGTGPITWNVTLAPGTYTFVCDAHASMHGSFTVGTSSPPITTPTITAGPPITTTTQAPPPVQPIALKASVDTAGKLHLLTAGGKVVHQVRSGPVVITVTDRSKTNNFHLKGPGVDKATGKVFRGTAHWSLKLHKGATYKFHSDAHPKVVSHFIAR